MQPLTPHASGELHWTFLWALGLATAAAWAEDASTVEKCGKKFGTITVVDPRTVGDLKQYGLGSPSALLRMMIQQSGCFDVVERGVAMQNIQQERALAQAGQLRRGLQRRPGSDPDGRPS